MGNKQKCKSKSGSNSNGSTSGSKDSSAPAPTGIPHWMQPPFNANPLPHAPPPPANIYPTAPPAPPASPYPHAPHLDPPPYSLEPPPHTGIQVQHPVGRETIIIQQPYVVQPTEPPVYFGKKPVELLCIYCRTRVKTKTTKSLTCDGKLTCACLLLCCILCSWLPCVCKGLYKIKHKCPSCDATLGKYS